MNTVASYSIKTETFEGPMELLIELVEKRKLLINDISLATVTDEYMQTVSAMQELSLPNTTHFILLAATLLLIKSKSLLPALDLTDEEEASIEDLEDRLKQYKIYRDAAIELQGSYSKNNLYAPEYTPPKNPLFVPDKFCDIHEMKESLYRVLTNLPKKVPKPSVRVRPTISLEDMMTTLERRITEGMQTKFSDIRATETEHKNVIVGFLAMLELFKQGNLIITQADRFEDIKLERDQAGTPQYY